MDKVNLMDSFYRCKVMHMIKSISYTCVLLLFFSLTGCVTTTSRGNLSTTYVGDFYTPDNNSSATPDTASDNTSAIEQQENGINEMNATMTAVQQQNVAAEQQALQAETDSMPVDKTN